MTGDFWIDNAISAIAIALIVFLIAALFGRRDAEISEDAARDRLRFDEPDFEPRHWLLDSEAGAALVAGQNDEFALVIRKGADLLTRRFRRSDGVARLDGGVITVDLHDLSVSAVRFSVVSQAEYWARAFRSDHDRLP